MILNNDQIATWLHAWNSANEATPDFRLLEADELIRDGNELAHQPLALLILAIYATELGSERLDSNELSGSKLYERMLDSFVRRQVLDKSVGQLDPREVALQVAYRRWQLSIAAFGMFNRGLQYITEDSLEADIGAFVQNVSRGERTTFDKETSRADQTISDFFFVQVYRIDESAGSDGPRTYEFLHSTFGEYLVAEQTVALLKKLARQHDLSAVGEGLLIDEHPNDDLLFALLSHQVLLKRQQTISFITEILDSYADLESIQSALTELLRRARSVRNLRSFDRYEPTPFDSICRIAVYTANIATLRIMLSPNDVSPVELSPRNVDPMTWWRSLVNLWESGVDEESWQSIVYNFGLTRGDAPIISVGDGPDYWERGRSELLLGYHDNEVIMAAGSQLVGTNFDVESDAHRILYEGVTSLVSQCVGTVPIGRLLPEHEKLFELVAAGIQEGRHLSLEASISLWRALAHYAGQLPEAIVGRLTSLLLRGDESKSGKRWGGLGCELAAVLAAHPALLLNNAEVMEVASDAEFPRVVTDAPTAVVMLWLAENSRSGAELNALRTLRIKFDQLAADYAYDITESWFAPEYLSYLRLERPKYWTVDATLMNALCRFSDYMLSRMAPDGVLFLVSSYIPGADVESIDDDADNDTPVLLRFLRRYLRVHERSEGEIDEATAVDILSSYARTGWQRP